MRISNPYIDKPNPHKFMYNKWIVNHVQISRCTSAIVVDGPMLRTSRELIKANPRLKITVVQNDYNHYKQMKATRRELGINVWIIYNYYGVMDYLDTCRCDNTSFDIMILDITGARLTSAELDIISLNNVSQVIYFTLSGRGSETILERIQSYKAVLKKSYRLTSILRYSRGSSNPHRFDGQPMIILRFNNKLNTVCCRNPDMVIIKHGIMYYYNAPLHIWTTTNRYGDKTFKSKNNMITSMSMTPYKEQHWHTFHQEYTEEYSNELIIDLNEDLEFDSHGDIML